MRSVRLDEETEHQLQQASRLTGETASEIVRQAVKRQCREILANRLDLRLADVIGSVSSRGKSKYTARDSGKAFAEILVKKHSRRRRK